MLQNSKCETLPELPKKCREILKSFDNGGNLSVAVLVADELLPYFSPVVFDEPKPDILKNYESMNYAEKNRFNKDNPDWRETIGGWEKEYRQANLTNASNIYWLTFWMGVLKGDPIRQGRVKDKLSEFTGNKPTQAEWTNEEE